MQEENQVMKPLIVIPTYNEIENIPKLLSRLLNIHPDIHVLVVDDNSPDGTGKFVASQEAGNSRIHLLAREKKAGIGPAYIAGFKWGLAREFDAFIEMDADLSHRPRYIPKIISALGRYDVVIGSRWMEGGGIGRWPIHRILLSRTANWYARFILGIDIKDLTGGFTGYRRRVLETLDLDSVHSDGYSFQIEMKYKSHRYGFRHVEIPIQFPDRKAGQSKISKRIILEALIIVWLLKFFKRPKT